MAELVRLMTNKGLEKEANCIFNHTNFEISHIAVGDGNGNMYIPQKTQTALINEVWRGEIRTLINESPKWTAMVVIPASVDNFTIREAGLFDSDGNLLFITQIGEIKKNDLITGQPKEVGIKMIFELSDRINVITIDPSVVSATTQYVENRLNEYQKLSEKDAPNGYCPLDENIFVPTKNTKNFKGYLDEGELLTDPEGLSDVTNYAHSTFDLSKFTVVGSPTITDNGIASGFSSSNYLSKSLTLTYTNTCEIILPFTTTSDVSNVQRVYYFGSPSSALTVALGNNSGKFTLGWQDVNGTQIITADTAINYLVVNTSYLARIKDDGVNYTISVKKITDNTWDVIKTVAKTNNLKLTETLLIGYSAGDTTHPFLGSIDLKQFSITVDGVPVFNGNQTGVDTYTINGSTITIPYNLSKTGSKIVDSAYRDRVTSVYEYLGYAPYYTLQENQEENYTIIGSPTISNGIASGFSTDDYISIPFSPAYSAWEIILKTKLNSTGTPILNCGTYSFNLAVAPNVQNIRNKLIINIGNGTTWATTNLLGVTELQANIDYYIKIKYTGTNYIISLSIDNISWTDEITYTSSTPINSNTLILGKDYLEASALNGAIDLNKLTINIEGNNSFKAIQPPNFTLPQGEIYGMMNKNFPVGTVMFGAFNTAPPGWLICDGSALSRVSYADLFNAIGTTFGSGDGSTTFNLPDSIDKVVNGNSTAGISTGITTSNANVGHTHSAWQYHGDYLTTSSAGQNHTHAIDSINFLPIIKY